jgi:hypothetical protein
MACPACAARGYSNTGRANDARARAADPDFRYGRHDDPAWPNQAETLRGISDCSRKSSKHLQHDETRTVSIDGKRVPLTGKEYCIFELLSLRKNTIVTKEMLLAHLYGGVGEPRMKIIDVFVCHLRKKAGAGDGWQTLYRDRLGSRLPDARSWLGIVTAPLLTGGASDSQ